jgi:hypothetical protein
MAYHFLPRFLTSLAGLSLVVGVLAQPPGPSATFLDTLAWNRYGTAYSVNGGVDSAGNDYVISTFFRSGVYDLNVTKYDISGNALFTKTLFSAGGANVTLKKVYIPPPANGKQYIYFQTQGATTKLFTNFCKFDSNGNLLFVESFGDSSHDFAPLAMGSDGTNDYVAVEALTSGNTEIVQYDSAVNKIHDLAVPIVADEGKFFHGKWFLNGFPQGGSSNTVEWEYVDPATGNISGSAQIPTLDNGTNTYAYQARSYVDNNGAVYFGVTVKVYADTNLGTPFATNHFIRCYASNGVQAWSSNSFVGPLFNITGPGSGGPIWTEVAGSGSNFSVETFDLNGNRTLSKSGFVGVCDIAPVSDNTGEYLFWRNVPAQSKLTVQRIDLTGTAKYTNSFVPLPPNTPPPGTDQLPQSFFDGAQTLNGVLYTYCMVSAQSMQSVAQRYVSGTTLSSLSGAASMGSNQSYTLKVQLNNPAPQGGVLVKLTSSSGKLLFPNNSATSSVAIPAGSIFANVTLHSGAVTSATKALVSGNQNGVIRQITITVNP